jgi:hypothetical protein
MFDQHEQLIYAVVCGTEYIAGQIQAFWHDATKNNNNSSILSPQSKFFTKSCLLKCLREAAKGPHRFDWTPKRHVILIELLLAVAIIYLHVHPEEPFILVICYCNKGCIRFLKKTKDALDTS